METKEEFKCFLCATSLHKRAEAGPTHSKDLQKRTTAMALKYEVTHLSESRSSVEPKGSGNIWPLEGEQSSTVSRTTLMVHRAPPAEVPGQ